MTHTATSLLARNLHGVFGEADDVRRRALVDDLFTEDALFVEPAGITRGRAAIAAIAGKIRATHPGFAYAELAPAENLHGLAGRLRWTSGEPERPPSYAGTDIIVVENGRIAALYLFFDPLP